MIIESLWITRKSEPFGTPELLVAWDEVSLDENSDGYREECQKALASCERDVEAVRYIQIKVDEKALDAAFAMATVESSVIDYRDHLDPASK